MQSCGQCGRFYKTLKIGVIVLERDDSGQPYQLWSADEKQCPECKDILVVYANQPFCVRGQGDFGSRLANARKAPNTYREVR